MLYTKEGILRSTLSRRRSVTGLNAAVLETIKLSYWWIYYKPFEEQRKKKKKNGTQNILVQGGSRLNTSCSVCWLALSHALLSGPPERILCSVGCSVQGRLQIFLLCLRYVDTITIGAWPGPLFRGVRR